MSTELLNSLRAQLGAAHVLTRESHDLAAYERDWRQRAHGHALAVVRPGSTDEVAAVLRACAAHGVSLVPQGGNTGLVVGSVPDDSGQQLVLSLQRMNRVRAIDHANLTMTVDAGCVLQAVQQAAEAEGLLFPLSLAAEGSCTIGGNLATNAGGTQVLRYGNARELCLGLEVVTPQGEVWHGLSGLRKDNTGYDLRDLYVGSEGTLGVITAATLKLFPQPAATLTAWAAVPSLQAAVDLLGLAQQRLAAGLTGFEVMGQFALSLVARHMPQLRVPLWEESPASAPGRAKPDAAPSGGSEPSEAGSVGTPYCVLLENSDSESEDHARGQFESLLETAFERGLVSDAVVAESIAQAQALWHVRESIPLAQAQEGLNIKHDISIPVSLIPAFCEETDALLQQAIPGVRLVNFGHLGDGNLHYNVQAPVAVDAKKFLQNEEIRINELVFGAVGRYHGSISAEHGVGSLKAAHLPHHKDPVALALMRRIKQALDPQQLCNPGRVLSP